MMRASALVLLVALSACGSAPDEASDSTSDTEVAQAAQPGNGRALFGKCAACHITKAGGPNGIGPNLHGVVGRAVAAAPGYAFSDAMKAKGGIWDDASLNAFLEAPRTAVPGTKMTFYGVKDAAERLAIIDYLKTAN